MGSGLNLLSGDLDGCGVVTFFDEPAEFGRSEHVGSLADVHEWDLVGQFEWFEARQCEMPPPLGNLARGFVLDSGRDRGDMCRGRSAASADDIDEAAPGELAQDACGLFGALVVPAERVRQSRVRIGADQGVGDGREIRDVRSHFGSAESAVQSDADWLAMTHRLPEGASRLARECASGPIGDGS